MFSPNEPIQKCKKIKTILCFRLALELYEFVNNLKAIGHKTTTEIELKGDQNHAHSISLKNRLKKNLLHRNYR